MEILNRIISLLGTRDQKELTDFLNLKKSAFTDWKSGKSNSYRKYLIEIAEFFNVSLDYIVYGIEKGSSTDITADEQELIDIYKGLSPRNQGRLIERGKMLLESQQNEKCDSVSEPVQQVSDTNKGD